MIFTRCNKRLVYDVEQPQTSKATSATPNIPHVKITTETRHKISWSSNRVERSTVRTDAGLVYVVSVYLPESQRNLQGLGREGGKAYRDYGFTSAKPATRSMSHCTGTE